MPGPQEATAVALADLARFYDTVPRLESFERSIAPASYVPLPGDWIVATADVVDSTGAIAAGRYKAVNMVGASVVAGTRNAMGGARFPFSFGGDGADLALPASARPIVEPVLSALQTWAVEAMSLRLRAALVPVGDIRSAGLDVAVTRYAVAREVDYAMFSGGGIGWAVGEMKAGRYLIPAAPPGSMPDLDGLSCRWQPIRAKNGAILSLILAPRAGADRDAFAGLVAEVLAIIEREAPRAGHPLPPGGPRFSLSRAAVDLESRVRSGAGRSQADVWRLRAFYLFVWLLFATGKRAGRFDPARYRLETAANTDFRKFEDGLKLTVDCSRDTIARIEALAMQAARAGLADYGLNVQDEALMTCIVPSPADSDHMHFVDGAGGGYAQAALDLKQRSRLAAGRP